MLVNEWYIVLRQMNEFECVDEEKCVAMVVKVAEGAFKMHEQTIQG